MSELTQNLQLTAEIEETPYLGRIIRISLWDGREQVDSIAITKEYILFLLGGC